MPRASFSGTRRSGTRQELLNSAADDSTPVPVVTPAKFSAAFPAVPARDRIAARLDALRGGPRADGRHDAGATPQRQPSCCQQKKIDALPVFGSGFDDEGESRPSVGAINKEKTLAGMVGSSSDGSFPLGGFSRGLGLVPDGGEGGLDLADDCRLDGACSNSVDGCSVKSSIKSPHASENAAFSSLDEDENVSQPRGLWGGLDPMKTLEDYCAFLFLCSTQHALQAERRLPCSVRPLPRGSQARRNPCA